MFIDVDANPMAAWNVMRGGFYTPSELPQEEQGPYINFWVSALLRNSYMNKFISELQLEEFRIKHFPQKVSRLRGIFVFDSPESALKVCENSNWGAHFSPVYLTDIGVNATRYNRFDAQWITQMINHNGNLVENWKNLAQKYWSGEETETPIWECIVEGHITIWGKNLKKKAYTEIQKFWPKSLKILEISANCFAIGSLDGAIHPAILKKENAIELKYYIRMVDTASENFVKKLSTFIQSDSPHKCVLNAQPILCNPDFTNFNKTIDIDPTTTQIRW